MRHHLSSVWSHWALIGVGIVAPTLLHFAAPTHSHAWHAAHLSAEKLYYAPILVAAWWGGLPGALLVTAIVSLLSLAHTWISWNGQPTVQAAQVAELFTYWLVAGGAGLLFDRERRASLEVAHAHRETLEELAASLDLREAETGAHCRRVRDYALLLARHLKADDPRLQTSLSMGAVLHDIGKIGIPDRILLKPAPLDANEMRIMRRHPEYGAGLIGPVPFLQPARDVVACHHERWDGSGYPRGLSGTTIPLAARIFAVADVFDALTSERPYHHAITLTAARQEIARQAGTALDPTIVRAFLTIPQHELGQVARDTASPRCGTGPSSTPTEFSHESSTHVGSADPARGRGTLWL